MDGYLALTIIVGLIVLGVTAASIFESLHPAPHKPLNKFDAIDKELKRLHADLSDYRNVPTWYAQEIKALNQALIKSDETEESA